MIPEIQEEEKPTELTHCLQNPTGEWLEDHYTTNSITRLIYLGSGKAYGYSNYDIFADIHENSDCVLYMGHLNSGKY